MKRGAMQNLKDVIVKKLNKDNFVFLEYTLKEKHA